MGKQPLGITPKWLIKEKRLREVSNAIIRYSLEGYMPLNEWFEELKELSIEIANDINIKSMKE